MAFTEKIGTLTKTSTTQVQLTGNSIIKLGGQQRVLQSPTLLTSVSGIGGLDTGAIAASSFYYVYAVYNGSATGIVASLSATSPTGFTRYKKVGAFYTDSGSLIFKAYKLGEVNKTTYTAKAALSSTISTEGEDFIQGNCVNGVCSFVPNLFSSIPNAHAESSTRDNIFSSNVVLSTTNWTFVCRNDPGVVLTSTTDMQLTCHKTGMDAIQPDWN